MSTFKQFWKSKDDMKFKYSVDVRVYNRVTDKRETIKDSGTITALSAYDANKKINIHLSNKYNNAIYSNFQLTQL